MDQILVGVALAQTQDAPAAGARGAGAGLPQFIQPLFLLGSFLLIFYFLLIRPQQRRHKETQKMLSALKRGDRVLTTGGLFGSVWEVKDDIVIVKIADELKVEVAKSAVQGVVSK